MDQKLRRSRRQEKKGAERFGGTVNPGSGNTGGVKNDVRTATESIEFKHTDKASFYLKLTELLTAGRHALLSDRRMLFGIEFGTGAASKRYLVIEEDDYLADQQLMRQAADKIEELLTDLAAANEEIDDLKERLIDASVGLV